MDTLRRSSKRALRQAVRHRWIDAFWTGVLATALVPLMLVAGGLTTRWRGTAATDPAELLALVTGDDETISLPDFDDVSFALEGQGGLARPVAYLRRFAVIGAGNDSRRAQVAYVSPGFLTAVGARFAEGRDFDARDGSACVLSRALAQRLPEAREASTITVNGAPCLVAGQLASPFAGLHPGDQIEVWLPLGAFVGTDGESPLRWRDARILRAAVRVRSEGERNAVAAVVARVSRDLADQHPATNRHATIRAVPVEDGVAETNARRAATLLGTLALVFAVVAALNLSALARARGLGQQPTEVIERALGARVHHLLLPLGLELAAITVVATLIGGYATALAGRVIAPDGGEFQLISRFNPVVAGATVVIATITVLLLYVAVNAGQYLAGSDAARRVVPRSRWHLHLTFLQCVLAVSAGSVALTLQGATTSLERLDVGFSTTELYAISASFERAEVTDIVARRALFEAAITQLRGIPGVAGVTALGSQPLIGWDPLRWPLLRSREGAASDRIDAEFDVVGTAFASTLGLPILAGRDLGPEDVGGGTPRAIVVSASLAERFWGADTAVGRTVFVRGTMPATVVGVVGDARFTDVMSPAKPRFFFLWHDSPNVTVEFLLRLEPGQRLAVESQVHAILATITSPTMLAPRLVAVDEIRHRALATLRTTAIAARWSALIVLTITAGGVFGVLAGRVANQRREIGIRYALGATPRHIASQLARELLLIGGGGAVTGALLAYALVAALHAAVPGLGPLDPLTIGTTVAILLVTLALAAWFPLRSATRIEPLETIRDS